MHKTLFPFPEDSEIATLLRIAERELRVVHAQRKRKLRRKGVRCCYFPYLGVYLWEPRSNTGNERPSGSAR